MKLFTATSLEVSIAAIILTESLWIGIPYNLVETNVSEKYTASIFIREDEDP
jgi:hypothetical protein